MLKTITFIGLLAALTVPQAAFAGAPTGYGTEGPYGQRLHQRSSFERHWNNFNESKWRAESSSRWMRRHGQSFPSPF